MPPRMVVTGVRSSCDKAPRKFSVAISGVRSRSSITEMPRAAREMDTRTHLVALPGGGLSPTW